jgi:two-component system response regulator MprA
MRDAPLNLRVLVVDDSGASADELSRALVSDGFEVEVVPDAAAAVHSVHAHEPGVVVLDLDMPAVDGFSARRDIRLQSRVLPVIAMTSHLDDETFQRTVDEGFFMRLVKPVAVNDLLGAVEAAVGCRPWHGP